MYMQPRAHGIATIFAVSLLFLFVIVINMVNSGSSSESLSDLKDEKRGCVYSAHYSLEDSLRISRIACPKVF